MIHAGNNLLVDNTSYAEDRTFNLDSGLFANKLSIQLLAADRHEQFIYGPAIIQVTERPEHTFEDELNTEQFLELGFNSRGFITPITAFRIRIPDLTSVPIVKPALLHFVFYG